MSTPGVHEEVVPVGGDRVDMRVQVRGEGPPLVYLHHAGGIVWDPFLEELAETRTIYAPCVPGTVADESEQVDGPRDLWELVLMLEECLQALDLEGTDLLGAGFGGMLACELQASFPGKFGALVALDPLGLWRESLPTTYWTKTRPTQLGTLLFADPSKVPAHRWLTQDGYHESMPDALATMTRPMSIVERFVPRDPERGLARRLHRIIAPTLVVWGEDDALVSPEYAGEFARRVRHAQVEILPRCGHVPQVERPEETLALVQDVLR